MACAIFWYRYFENDNYSSCASIGVSVGEEVDFSDFILNASSTERKHDCECEDCPIYRSVREDKFNCDFDKFECVQNHDCNVDAFFVNKHIGYAKYYDRNCKYPELLLCAFLFAFCDI